MINDPLTPEQCEGVLGALTTNLETSDFEGFRLLADALRHGGSLTTKWTDSDDVINVYLAVPAGFPLNNATELEEELFSLVRRAIGSTGYSLRSVSIVLALAREGWRTAPKAELPGRLAGRFLLEDAPFKKGGFGVVYKAMDVLTDDEVAIKILGFPSDAGPVEREQYYLRFRREMQLMWRLDHPNLMSVLWYGQEDTGLLWYAMPLAAGSLEDRLAEFPDNSDRILNVLTSVCDAVTHLHREGIVHRDLSPGNVLVMPDGQWVVADLGLAFDLDRELTVLTTTGMSMGTAGYRPPDAEANNPKHALPGWDIYSLGQICADMCLGAKYKDRKGVLPEEPFGPAITRACHFDPSQRFESVEQFLAECRRLVELSTSWESPDDLRTRIIGGLANEGSDALHELALLVPSEIDIEPYVGALTALSDEQIQGLADSVGLDLAIVAFAIIDVMPGQWTPFGQLDSIAHFLIAAAQALGDARLVEKALVWVLEVGHEWDRWNVQSQAETFMRQLADKSPEIVARALGAISPEAVPSDLSWLHPAARPVPVANADDEEPF